MLLPTTFVYILTTRLFCLGSEFQHYSIDCEFAYQSPIQAFVLELQVCSSQLNIC